MVIKYIVIFALTLPVSAAKAEALKDTRSFATRNVTCRNRRFEGWSFVGKIKIVRACNEIFMQQNVCKFKQRYFSTPDEAPLLLFLI